MMTPVNSALTAPLGSVFAFTAKPGCRHYALRGFLHPMAAFKGALGPDPDPRLNRDGLSDELRPMPSDSKTGSKTQSFIFDPPHLFRSGPTSYPPNPD